MISVPVVQLDASLPLPVRARLGDGGVDLVARESAVLVRGGGRALVPTGISVAIPLGYGGLVLPRSGLAAKHGVTVLNAPGLIDAGYRGEVMVPLVNTDPDVDFEVKRGERIAQLLVMPIPEIAWDVVVELPPASSNGSVDRGTAGFGSSGR